MNESFTGNVLHNLSVCLAAQFPPTKGCSVAFSASVVHYSVLTISPISYLRAHRRRKSERESSVTLYSVGSRSAVFTPLWNDKADAPQQTFKTE